MGKQLISSGFIVLLFMGWTGQPTVNQEDYSHKDDTCLSIHHSAIFFQAEIDVLTQSNNSFKLIKYCDCDFDAIFLSTLFSHAQVTKSIPQELHEARKESLLSCLYPAHEFS